MLQDPVTDVVPVPKDKGSLQGNGTDYYVSLGLFWKCCFESSPTMWPKMLQVDK